MAYFYDVFKLWYITYFLFLISTLTLHCSTFNFLTIENNITKIKTGFKESSPAE